MDHRIKGKKVSQITKKFVRENLTDEEKSKKYSVISKQKKYNTIYVESFEELDNVINELSGKEVVYLNAELDFAYFEDKQEQVDAVDWFYGQWREDIKQNEKNEKEYAEYLKLKKKYEGEDNG